MRPKNRDFYERIDIKDSDTYTHISDKQAFDILSKGGNISAVFRHELPDTYKSYKVINADESDLRFTDDVNVICGLKAKGKAIKDYSGFVLE